MSAPLARITTKKSRARTKKMRNRPGKSPPAKRPQKRKEMLDSTRIAILQSALNHFGRAGFEGASVRTIAADAGVNHGMIRHIYGSKEELWRQAITFLFARISNELSDNPEALVAVSDRDRMKATIRRYVEYCARYPEHARMMIQQSVTGGPKLTWAAEQFIHARHNRDLPFLDKLKKNGDIPQVDTIALHFIIVGAAQMIYLLAPEVRAVDGRDVFESSAIEKHADALVKLLFR